MGSNWYPAPMQVTIDSGGRIFLPKSLRDSLGLLPGTKADISPYGNGLQVTPGGAHRSTGGGRGRTSRGQISHRCHRRHDARTHGRRPQMKNRPRLAVDTSVSIPLLVASHQAHEAVHAWAKGRRLSLSGHALAENYAVLTRLPGDARVSPADAVRLIDDWFLETLTLPTASIVDVHRRLARLGISGGAVYDGIVALAALENGAILATRDARARVTYEAVGTSVEILHSADSAEE